MPFVVRYRILYSGEPYTENNRFGLRALDLPLLSNKDLKIETHKGIPNQDAYKLSTVLVQDGYQEN